MTIKEFQAHYDEYVKNFILNAKTFDLNFKEYMLMKGLPEEDNLYQIGLETIPLY